MLLILFITGAVFAAYQMYDMASEYRAGEQIYTQLQKDMVASDVPAPVTEPVQQVTLPATDPADFVAAYDINIPSVNFQQLEMQNPDTVGWVYIEDTNINYPVVQGTDNRHYVSTLFDGSVNQAGSIFMDFRNDPEIKDIHTILYGHNMRNKTMFADILNYQSQEYYDAHPVGIYLTKDKSFVFEIVAGYVASVADAAWQLEFVNEEDVDIWLKDAMARTSFQSRIEPQTGDQYITLSTCSYEFADARFVLVGVLLEI